MAGAGAPWIGGWIRALHCFSAAADDIQFHTRAARVACRTPRRYAIGTLRAAPASVQRRCRPTTLSDFRPIVLLLDRRTGVFDPEASLNTQYVQGISPAAVSGPSTSTIHAIVPFGVTTTSVTPAESLRNVSPTPPAANCSRRPVCTFSRKTLHDADGGGCSPRPATDAIAYAAKRPTTTTSVRSALYVGPTTTSPSGVRCPFGRHRAKLLLNGSSTNRLAEA
jgi:hypothetical protein